MPHYLLQVAYSIEGWKALVKKPQNRIEAVRPAIEKLGGKKRPRCIRKILLGFEPHAQWGRQFVGRHLVPQRDRDDNAPDRRSRSRVGPG